MASSSAALLLHHSLPLIGGAALHRATVRCRAASPSSPHPESPQSLAGRRRCLLLLALSSVALPSAPALSEDIGLFGLRRRIKKIEEEAEKIVEKGEEAVERGIVVAEKEIQAAEEGIVASTSLRVAGDLLQAGAVVGAEAVGVLVGVAVVNGILAPER